ncbi:MAG: PAS domain-containing protein [Flavonifractor plautii]
MLDGTRASGLEDYQADDELRPILRYIDKLMERLGGYIQSITAERDKVGLILDCMDEGLILLDEAGNVLAINRAARTLFGFPEGEEDDGALLSPAAAACGRPFRSPASATPPWCWTWMPSPRTPRACACLSPPSPAASMRGRP